MDGFFKSSWKIKGPRLALRIAMKPNLKVLWFFRELFNDRFAHIYPGVLIPVRECVFFKLNSTTLRICTVS